MDPAISSPCSFYGQNICSVLTQPTHLRIYFVLKQAKEQFNPARLLYNARLLGTSDHTTCKSTNHREKKIMHRPF